MIINENINICIIGLGYVGLSLAVEFGKKYRTTGYDISEKRVKELLKGYDRTLQVDENSLKSAEYLTFTYKTRPIAGCNYYIITVPTPVNKHNIPDMELLYSACKTVGKAISPGDTVIIESTVYPGFTEEEAVPLLEKYSGLKFNRDFFCGYSPERINPGDKKHVLAKIKKVVSGSTKKTLHKIDELYKSIIEAGTYITSSIKVAEAAKIIENSQRDINIAFINEIARIFHKMDIDTSEVLEAAGTKWNFLNFKPGLVGGHCIGVDPYYLAYKAQSLGYIPEIILAGRRLNDYMAFYVAGQVIKLMIKKGHIVNKSEVLVLGITYKENCPDVRNSKVVDLVKELEEFGIKVYIYDPRADEIELRKLYNLSLEKEIYSRKYNALICAVGHDNFREIDFEKIRTPGTVIYDVKGFLRDMDIDGRL